MSEGVFWILWILFIAVIVCICFWIGTYNSLVESRNWRRNCFKNVEVQLRRRYDLIPALVECVKGYSIHETKTLEAVVKARNAGLRAKTEDQCIKAAKRTDRSLKQLFGIVERYPDLKASKNFISLQCSIFEIEYDIACSRNAYNDSARNYNNMVMRWPDKIVAENYGFKPDCIDIIPETERDALQSPPKINFD